MSEEKEMGATHQARQARIQILAETVKAKKALSLDEVYKFAINRWLISLRVINDYIRELTATGKYKIETKMDGDWLVYLGE
jgi:hypothetical protein